MDCWDPMCRTISRLSRWAYSGTPSASQRTFANPVVSCAEAWIETENGLWKPSHRRGRARRGVVTGNDGDTLNAKIAFCAKTWIETQWTPVRACVRGAH